MVVSKDSKRKRKESPPPQPPMVESSPEMPKRTKVQAQRKFAQGQSAPTSSYASAIPASSSSTTGPSASSESREPPTEILPNKRPKTEDFLTFLCFRGTSALPAHLDFLNQGKIAETEDTPNKKQAKATKPPKKQTAAKKGRKTKPKTNAKDKANTKCEIEPIASTSAAAAVLMDDKKPTINNNDSLVNPINDTEKNLQNQDKKQDETNLSTEETLVPFAVRKRAEQVAEGNRRNRAPTERLQRNMNTETTTPSKPQEIKRRSNRTTAKEMKSLVEPDTDEDDAYISETEEVGQKLSAKEDRVSKNSKTPTRLETKSQTPTKESTSPTVDKNKKGKIKKVADEGKVDSLKKDQAQESPQVAPKEEANKVKPTVKRPRQKESPIFIPSPEPTGRMTRQRAFFEPVKVLPRDEEPANLEKCKKDEILPTDINENKEKVKLDEVVSKADDNNKDKEAKPNKEDQKDNLKKVEEPKSKNKSIDNQLEDTKNSSRKNIFDFSSDDEQPLAKSIKLKKKTASPKKVAQNVKRQAKKIVLKKPLKNSSEKELKEKHEESTKIEKLSVSEKIVVSKPNEGEPLSQSELTGEKKRLNLTKKKTVSEENQATNESKIDPQEVKVTLSTAKKPLNIRQQRKKGKPDESTPNGSAPNEESELSPPVQARSQRPSRKTKEAAAIYMGIIGHKLQQKDDEDDDLSLNSFPDLPNVKEMEKMEFELKKNATQTTAVSIKTSATSPTFAKSPSKSTAADSEKHVSIVRRGRPPKQGKPPLPAKREIEGMLVKKGALAKVIANVQTDSPQIGKGVDQEKVESEDEDFLLNEEVKETKRKLEKSFSDSDDEPLAIKVNLKTNEMDLEQNLKKSNFGQQIKTTSASTTTVETTVTTTLTSATVLPIGSKQVPTPSPTQFNVLSLNTSPITATQQNASSQSPSLFKIVEKKSPIPNSKILNVPAAYTMPSTQNSNVTPNIHANYNKIEHKLISGNMSSAYLPPVSPHYHPSHTRSSHHPTLPAAKSPTQPPPPTLSTHIAAPPPPQSPLKYQTPPTTYPPPIEAYPSPKINPNFLTPKFDRSALPRTNNFPSPSPVKFDLSSTTTKTGIANSTLSPKTLPTLQMGSTALLSATPSTSAAAVGIAVNASSDPLKDEIGSILAANLMPSKEESGKIFGIASVSLAQSSGPDNTKCTLGKCGSIHKPALGPVVPTEGYIGDQLSSKERRKAKVNMTHEQIQKWLIECSSNPDEIHDDLDDDFDDNLRPNLFATTPPPTRDDKESTSFSSSSKATRDLGKSESAWSGKGPSLKAIPVVATANLKEEDKKEKQSDLITHQLQTTSENETHSVNLIIKSSAKQNTNNDMKNTKEKLEKQLEKKSKDDKLSKEANKEKEGKQNKTEKEKEKEKDKEKEHTTGLSNIKSTAAGKQSTSSNQNLNSIEAPTSSKGNRKKGAVVPTAKEEKLTAQKPTVSNTIHTALGSKIQKRTPVYNQKVQKQIELKETTTTSHKKKSPFSYTFGAFSADNEKSIYSFDKDDEDVGAKLISKPVFRRQSRRDSHPDDVNSTPTPNLRTSPTKQKRSAAAAAEKANKDIANASQSSSVSLTLSPSENCKPVKVSLEAEQQTPASSKAKSGKFKNKLDVQKPTADIAAADSDSDGHTFYIPLQGAGMGGSAEGGIQGVAVKLGREGPEGPNQKVIMHATLVTKAQMGQNSKPLPDSMNASEIVKNLLISSANTTSGSTVADTSKQPASPQPIASTSAGVTTSAAAAANSASNSLKSVPIGTVQPRFKGVAGAADSAASAAQPSTSIGASGGGGLVRVNSNSSLFSGSAKSRHGTVPAATAANTSKKFKDDTPIKMSNNTAFPRHDDPTQMVEAPIFRPTEKEFSDPIDFIERITPIAARFGICKIIPPASFKPECRISDEMRFTAYNQYVHKMLHRWGPSAKELSAIKKYLATQSITMNHPPWIGGMEVDLPRLYHTVQEQGGLKEVIEKKKWARVAEEMCIPKLAQDRVTKLDDIYCKYLLPYDTLSPSERQKLFDEVEADWAKREARARRNADRFVNTESVSNEENDVSSDDDEESEEEVDGVSMECIVKGRSMPLSQFYRIARNTMTLWYKNTEPVVNEVEADFWRHVAVRDSHVCVHSGSIDSSGWGYGFPSPGPKGKGSNYARHPWNLKVLTNNPSSVLRSLGPVMGVTVPTLHVGMLFSACCWYRDPHGLSWIEYLHTGASKLWYGIPDDQSANFRSALTSLIPTHCQNKTIWLPCDTVMVPPHMLTDRSVSLCRIEQKPGEFIVVFPRAYTSSLAAGYVVSESVYFATNSWLDLAKDDFRDIHDSCEPAMFSLEQLLFALGGDQRVSPDTLQQMLPMLNEVYEKETAAREQLKAAGVTSTEKVPNEKGSKSKKQQHPVKSIESECDLCRANLYISMVKTDEGNVYCLQHALKNLNNGNIQAKQCKLIFAYYIEDIENLIKDLSDKIQQKRSTLSNKKTK